MPPKKEKRKRIAASEQPTKSSGPRRSTRNQQVPASSTSTSAPASEQKTVGSEDEHTEDVATIRAPTSNRLDHEEFQDVCHRSAKGKLIIDKKGHKYANLWHALWPTKDTPIDVQNPEAALLDYIDTDSATQAFHDATVELDGPDLEAMQAVPAADGTTIRYVDMLKHKIFRIGKLAREEKLIILDEYTRLARVLLAHYVARFLDPTMQTPEMHFRRQEFIGRVFWTGQPGVGKSLGAGYMLAICLSFGIPCFWKLEEQKLLYFSSYGIQACAADPPPSEYDQFEAAAEYAWAIVDVDLKNLNWSMPVDGWPNATAMLVWSSSPNTKRRHHFEKFYKPRSQGRSQVWHMKPWSLPQLAWLARANGIKPTTLANLLRLCGPVPRTVMACGADSLTIETLKRFD